MMIEVLDEFMDAAKDMLAHTSFSLRAAAY